jgi:hypothetical protein
MEIYLSKEELEREKCLFSPHDIVYPLDGIVLDILGFKEEAVSGDDMAQAPTSC